MAIIFQGDQPSQFSRIEGFPGTQEFQCYNHKTPWKIRTGHTIYASHIFQQYYDINNAYLTYLAGAYEDNELLPWNLVDLGVKSSSTT